MEGRTDWQAQQRARLLDSIEKLGLSEAITNAIAAVPRERFVPGVLQDRAYDDNALPIGSDQTISQPSLVALMIAEMRIQPADRVLEVGTGSGYQAAVLAKLAREVVSVERVPELAERARIVLQELGITNVEVRDVGDQLGWPDGAPYDSIIVAAAAPEVPSSLVRQLRTGGRLVIPVGNRIDQSVTIVTRTEDGFEARQGIQVRFVPLVGSEAFPN
jgi:protein-L-isoaspartate(D-aspartate) O-methyltransferase